MKLTTWAYEQAKSDGERRQNIKKKLIDCIKNEKFADEYRECDVCHKKFFDSWGYRSHMLTHEEPKVNVLTLNAYIFQIYNSSNVAYALTLLSTENVI
jgi:hypothetical protein